MSNEQNQDLPEHERNSRPDEAFRQAQWILPYLRAGSEAYKRGEDYFGGSEQYDRELKALQCYYQTDPSEKPLQSSDAPQSPPDPRLTRIHDVFKQRLEGQERKLAALHKRYSQSPNNALSQHIANEEKQAAAVKNHLQNISRHLKLA